MFITPPQGRILGWGILRRIAGHIYTPQSSGRRRWKIQLNLMNYTNAGPQDLVELSEMSNYKTRTRWTKINLVLLLEVAYHAEQTNQVAEYSAVTQREKSGNGWLHGWKEYRPPRDKNKAASSLGKQYPSSTECLAFKLLVAYMRACGGIGGARITAFFRVRIRVFLP